MKRFFSFLLILAVFIQLVGCSHTQVSESQPNDSVKITVVTSYGGDDGNRNQYEKAVQQFTEKTAIQVLDHSNTSSEEWKTKVLSDFITGSEPDVLFYFVGADAEPFINANKVVSIEEIRQEYPEYASNMKRSMAPVATNGKHYAVPSTGFWESLFVNKTVLDKCGISVPGPDYTWDQFLLDCENIKEHGYIPIACSLAEIPHYWFEFTIMNNGSVFDQYQRPQLKEDGRLVDDAVSRKWIRGLNDIKYIYESGYFPPNTLTAKDADTVELFAEGKAAFLLDGSWKVGFLTENYPENVKNYKVAYFPGKAARDATDAIGGISMGYFISRRAWDDPVKRDAAVQFVSYMTSDDVLSTFVTTEVTALKNGAHPVGLNPLQQSAADAMMHLTAMTGAVQDTISGEAKRELFSNIPKIADGKMSAADAIKSALRLN